MLWDEVDPGDPFTPEQETGARRLDPLGRPAHHQRSRFARPAQRLVPRTVSAGDERRPAEDRGRRPGDRRIERQLDDLDAKAARRAAQADSALVGDQAQRCKPGATASAEHRRAVRRTPSRPRPHRRLRHATFRTRLHQLALAASKASSTPACCAGRRANISPGYFGDVTLAWADENLKDRRLDAALNTNLRYFARDLGVDTAYHFEDVQRRSTTPQSAQYQPAAAQPADAARISAARTTPGGIGAWNDFSATANAARGALREAAGVEVPGCRFRRALPGRVPGRARAAQLARVSHARPRRMGLDRRARSSPSSAPGSSCSGPSSISASSARKPKSASSNSSPIIRARTSRATRPSTRRSRRRTISSSATSTTLIAPFPQRRRLPIAERPRPHRRRLPAVRQCAAGRPADLLELDRHGPQRANARARRPDSTRQIDRHAAASKSKTARSWNCTACASCEADRAEARKPARLEGRWIGDLLPGQSVAR